MLTTQDGAASRSSYALRSKLFYFSLIESALMIGISVGQVALIRWLFDSRGSKRYRV